MAISRMQRRIGRWIAALIYTALIFIIANFVTDWWIWFTNQMGVERGGQIIDKAVPIVGIAIILALVIAVGRRAPTTYMWLIAAVGGYAYLLTLHAEYPVERIHLIQYSLLAWFYFRALNLDLGVRFSFVFAALAVFIVGATDEVIQYYIPDRSMSLADMTINWFAGGIGLVGLLAIHPEGIPGWLSRRSAPIRSTFGYVAPLLLAVVAAHQVWTRYIHPPLNVIVITVDCARADRFGIYGYERPVSNYLDALFEDGVRFTQAYSQAAWTGPGVISTLTGLLPSTHGVNKGGQSIPEAVITLQDVFREKGYSVPNLSYLTTVPNYSNLGATPVPEFGDNVELSEMETLNRWISNHHREQFFVWFHYRDVHLPYESEQRFRLWPPANDPKATPPPEIQMVQEEVIVPIGEAEFTERSKPWLDALYDAEINKFDHHLESLRYRLSLHHILDNTLIVITADHGEELMEHGYVGHASTMVQSRHYDEHLHIPLLFYCPREIPRGKAVDLLASQIDIAPTILDIMGWEAPEDMQGRSLVPAMMGEPMEEVPVFSESIEGGYQSKPEMHDTWMRSLRTNDWKLIAKESPELTHFELYDLVKDPNERVNRFDAEPEMAGRMYAQLQEWVTRQQEGREKIIDRQKVIVARRAKLAETQSFEIPEILTPEPGAHLDFDSTRGSVTVKWTGNPKANYVIQYHVGTGWHSLKGKMPVEGNEKTFGPVPRDGWKPLHQWNPFRLRVRPRNLREGWSDWITVTVEPLPEDD